MPYQVQRCWPRSGQPKAKARFENYVQVLTTWWSPANLIFFKLNLIFFGPVEMAMHIILAAGKLIKAHCLSNRRY